MISQEQVIYKFLATRIYKFIGWRAGGRHFEEVGLVNLGVSSGELSFSKSYMVDKRGHHDVGLAMLMNYEYLCFIMLGVVTDVSSDVASSF